MFIWLLKAGKFIGSAVSGYKIWAAIIAAAALVAALVLYVHGAEQAKGKALVLQDRLVRIETTARNNQAAVELCRAVNEANALQAARQAEKVRHAEIEIAALRSAADARVKPITREAEALRGRGLECPALDSDFRLWVLSK